MADGVGTTHHVKIGGIFCMLDSYRKRPAPIRGARVATGDRDWSDLSIWQRWVQHCWAGGIGADKWVDDSMFDSAVGTDSTIHEQLSLSRDLTIATGGALNAGSLDEKRLFHIHAKSGSAPRLYCITTPSSGSSYLWQYLNSNNTWTLIKTFTDLQATSITGFSNELCIGMSNGRIKSAQSPAAGPWATRRPPKGESAGVTAMKKYRKRLYVAYGSTIYRRKWNWKVDGKTEFYNARADGGGDVVTMETHLGFLYMGSQGGHIHRTDGNNTFDLWSWDGGVTVVSMRSFDGRLFIGTFEYDDDDDIGFGAIYQMTGSAVTMLKRWGLIDKATSIGQFRTYARRMFYGASNLWGMNRTSAGVDEGGFGVAVYDATEDAHSIWASNKDTTAYTDGSGTGVDYMVDDVIFFKGRMHVAVRAHGNFFTTSTFRDYLQDTVNYDTTKSTATGASNSGFLVSSIYDGGTPGLLKMWRHLTIEANFDNQNTDVEVQYSIDKGGTWTSLGTLKRTLTGTLATIITSPTIVGTGTNFTDEVEVGDELNIQTEVLTVDSVDSDTALTATANAASSKNGTAYHTKENFTRDFSFGDVRSSRIQYRLILNSTSGTQSPFVTGVIVSYLPIPEPNWVWDLTVFVADRFVKLDGVEDTQDEETQFDTLAGYFRDQKIIEFVDRDGTVWAGAGEPGVLIWDYNEDWHLEAKAGEPTEGIIRITLIEVQEDY